MPGKVTTRADLVQALYDEIGLSRDECAEMFEAVLKEVTIGLVDGEPVKVSNFGVFTVRQKAERIGRNPKTREEVMIKPRRVVVFKPSRNLKAGINDAGTAGGSLDDGLE